MQLIFYPVYPGDPLRKNILTSKNMADQETASRLSTQFTSKNLCPLGKAKNQA